MSDLAAFLMARLDEDDRVARAAIGPTGRVELGPGRWEAGSGTVGHVEADDFDIYDEGTFNSATAEHIARHDPARVLTDVEAKRRVVELWIGDTPLTPEHRSADDYYWYALRDVLRLLSLPYADHPDYQQKWKP